MIYPDLCSEILGEAIDISPTEYVGPLKSMKPLVKEGAPLEKTYLSLGPVINGLEDRLSDFSVIEFNDYCKKIEKATGLKFKPEEGLRLEGDKWGIVKQRYPNLVETEFLFLMIENTKKLPENVALGNYSSVTDQAFVKKLIPPLLEREVSVEEASHALIDRERGYTREMVGLGKKSGIIQHIGEIESKIFVHNVESREFEEALENLTKKYSYSVIGFLLGSLNWVITPKNKDLAELKKLGVKYDAYLDLAEFTKNDVHGSKAEELAKAISIKTLKGSGDFHDKIMALDETVLKRYQYNSVKVFDYVQKENAIRDEIANLKLNI